MFLTSKSQRQQHLSYVMHVHAHNCKQIESSFPQHVAWGLQKQVQVKSHSHSLFEVTCVQSPHNAVVGNHSLATTRALSQGAEQAVDLVIQ